MFLAMSIFFWPTPSKIVHMVIGMAPYNNHLFLLETKQIKVGGDRIVPVGNGHIRDYS
jgi:hypothetical protein